MTMTLTQPTLRIDGNAPAPQYWIGMTAWIGRENGIQGTITGAKLVNGCWHYLITHGTMDCWGTEEDIVPVTAQSILYKGYEITIAPSWDDTAGDAERFFQFTLCHLQSGTVTVGVQVGWGAVDAFCVAKAAVDHKLQEGQS